MFFLHSVAVTVDANGNPNVCASVHNTSIKYDSYADKAEMEQDHINHFHELVIQQAPDYSFDILSPEKNDPPDFWITRQGKKIGLEITMLIFRELREEVRFFDQIQNKILAKYKNSEIANLERIEIDVSFDEHDVNRPTALTDEDLNELILQLNNLASKPFEPPRPFDLEQNGLSVPIDPYPLGQSGAICNGMINWYVSSIGDINIKTDLGRAAGFEISHSHKFYSKDDIFGLLNRTIDAKDKEKNKGYELLISTTMRDLNGWVTTIEEQLINIVLDEWKAMQTPPNYLNKIYLYLGGQRKVDVLFDRDLAG